MYKTRLFVHNVPDYMWVSPPCPCHTLPARSAQRARTSCIARVHGSSAVVLSYSKLGADRTPFPTTYGKSKVINHSSFSWKHTSSIIALVLSYNLFMMNTNCDYDVVLELTRVFVQCGRIFRLSCHAFSFVDNFGFPATSTSCFTSLCSPCSSLSFCVGFLPQCSVVSGVYLLSFLLLPLLWVVFTLRLGSLCQFFSRWFYVIYCFTCL